jgi:tetratricopeptide (TPR) repeat protein
LLLFISAVAILRARQQPFLAVGWFWFLGTLAPVIGLVQAGFQPMADRYTYVPLIGIFIMAAWGIPTAWTRWPQPGLVFGAVVAGVLGFLLAGTEAQLQYWRDSVALFSHTAAVTRNNILAEYNLAEALARRGDEAQAVVHYQRALAIEPNRVEARYNSQTQAHFNLGLIFREQQQWEAAAGQFRACLRDDPSLTRARNNLEAVLREMSNDKAQMAK